MAILSRTEMINALADGINDSVDETIYALFDALEAWAKYQRNVQPSLAAEYYSRARELTRAAGIDWPEEVQP